jgi:hypothetical protein
MGLRRNRYDERTETAPADAPARRTGYDVTRALFTLVGAAAAGFLLWLATQIGDGNTGGYWAVYGIVAGAGLVIALSQLFGGWTKWGLPRISAPVFLLAFVPTLVVAGFVLAAHQPDPNWLRDHVQNWTGDLHVRGLVNDFEEFVPVLAFGIGLVFGLSFDTTGPRRRRLPVDREHEVVGRDRDEAVVDRRAADEPTTAERTAVTTPQTTHDRDGDGADDRDEEVVATRRGRFLGRR